MAAIDESSIFIASDLACARCGYNLRGLRPEQPCPECGLATHRTMAAGGQLVDAAPRWVTTIAWGATLLFMSYVGPIVAASLAGTQIYHRYRFAGPAVLLFIVLIHAIGAWLVTAAEPGSPAGSRGWRRAATVALRLLAAAPVAAVLWFILSMRGGGFGDDGPLIVTMAALLACPALTMIRLQYLTRRLGRPRVAEHAFLAGFDLSLTLTVAATLTALNLRGQWVLWIAGVVIAAGVFWVWSLWTLMMIGRSLWLAVRQARATWRAADAAQYGR